LPHTQLTPESFILLIFPPSPPHSPQRRKKRPDVKIPDTRDDRDRFGRPNTIKAVVRDTPVHYASLARTKLPRFASLDAAKINAWHNPTYRSKERSMGPGQYDIGRFASLSRLDPIASPRTELRTAPPAFGSRDERFRPERYEPEPTHKPIISRAAVDARPPDPALPRSPRFSGRSRNIAGNGAFDQMYDVDSRTALVKALAKSGMKYHLVSGKGARFSSSKAVEKNTFRTPNLKPSEAQGALESMGPGYYDPPAPTVRVRSAKRRSAGFQSATPRFSYPFWGNSTPIVSMHLPKGADPTLVGNANTTASAPNRQTQNAGTAGAAGAAGAAGPDARRGNHQQRRLQQQQQQQQQQGQQPL
jgi:hypothetical protein